MAFPLFRKGDGRTAENVMWRDRQDGLALRGFDFSYYDETQDDGGHTARSYKHFTCVMAQVDGAWPEVSISREGFLEKALDLVGLGDIELESDEFNRRFALRSPDRRFAVTLVDAADDRLPPLHRGAVRVLREGPLGPARQRPGEPRPVPALMRVGEAFVEHIPRVVYELWPSPFRDEDGTRWPRATTATAPRSAAAELAEQDPWTVLRSQSATRRSRRAAVPSTTSTATWWSPSPRTRGVARPKPLPE